MSFFTTFGSFSIAAGILLIFLIFVMLAAERRSELGIARAVGTRRGHLVQMFIFEGVAYDLAAALVGALLGARRRLRDGRADGAGARQRGLRHRVRRHGAQPARRLRDRRPADARGRRLSAWRVSRMTIATAIRNLPEPPAAAPEAPLDPRPRSGSSLALLIASGRLGARRRRR